MSVLDALRAFGEALRSSGRAETAAPAALVPPAAGEPVWVVGRITGPKGQFEFCGVYSTERKAVARCVTRLHFVAPATVDAFVPDDTQDWPGAYYPAQRPGWSPEAAERLAQEEEIAL